MNPPGAPGTECFLNHPTQMVELNTGKLLLSAMDVASVDDPDAFRAALEMADFDSTRGDFAFNSNHHPIQDIYVREVVREGDVLTNRVIGTAMENRGDAYASECQF